MEKKDKSDRNMKREQWGYRRRRKRKRPSQNSRKRRHTYSRHPGPPKPGRHDEFKFMVRGGRVYHLRAETAEDRDEWIDAIEAWIDYYQ